MVIRLLFSALLLTCIFDPADSILGLKVPLFIMLMGYSIITRRFSINVKGLFGYVLLFSVVLPILSFLLGILTNEANYDNPNLFGAIKPYLFLFIAFCFYSDLKLQYDIIKILSYELLLLSIVSLLLLWISITGIVPFGLLYEFGNNYTVYSLGERSFGPFVLYRIYFHTSPMLVFALCFFINQYYALKRFVYLFLSFFVAIALLLSGTRNDMIMGIIPYFVFAYLYGNRKTRMKVILWSSIFSIYLMSQELVISLFDKTESSNSLKIGFLSDYERAFSNIRTIIVGDGLDSYFLVSERGRANITELTYLELLRRFGIFGAGIYLYLMFKPVRGLLKRKGQQWIGLAYGFYLIMIFFNPFFFSSNGMIILSIVIVCYFTSVNHRYYYNQLNCV